MAKFTFKSFAVKELGGGAKGAALYRKMRKAWLTQRVGNAEDERMFKKMGELMTRYEHHEKRAHKRATAAKKHISKRKTSPGKMSAYNCYMSKHMKMDKYRKSYPEVKKRMAHLAHKWSKLSAAEKAKYAGKCAKKTTLSPKQRTSLKRYIIKHLMAQGKSLCDASAEYHKMREAELKVFKEMRKAGKRKGTKRGVPKGTKRGKRSSPTAYACYVRKERKAGIELAAIRKAWKKLTKAQKASHKCEKLASPLKRKAAPKKAKSPKKAACKPKKAKKASPKKAKKSPAKKATKAKKAKKSPKTKKVAKK